MFYFILISIYLHEGIITILEFSHRLATLLHIPIYNRFLHNFLTSSFYTQGWIKSQFLPPWQDHMKFIFCKMTDSSCLTKYERETKKTMQRKISKTKFRTRNVFGFHLCCFHFHFDIHGVYLWKSFIYLFIQIFYLGIYISFNVKLFNHYILIDGLLKRPSANNTI